MVNFNFNLRVKREYYSIDPEKYSEALKAIMDLIKTEQNITESGYSEEVYTEARKQQEQKRIENLSKYCKKNIDETRPEGNWSQFTAEEIIAIHEEGFKVPEDALAWAYAEIKADQTTYVMIADDVADQDSSDESLNTDDNSAKLIQTTKGYIIKSENAKEATEEAVNEYMEKLSDAETLKNEQEDTFKKELSEIEKKAKEWEALDKKQKSGEKLTKQERSQYLRLSDEFKSKNMLEDFKADNLVLDEFLNSLDNMNKQIENDTNLAKNAKDISSKLISKQQETQGTDAQASTTCIFNGAESWNSLDPKSIANLAFEKGLDLEGFTNNLENEITSTNVDDVKTFATDYTSMILDIEKTLNFGEQEVETPNENIEDTETNQGNLEIQSAETSEPKDITEKTPVENIQPSNAQNEVQIQSDNEIQANPDGKSSMNEQITDETSNIEGADNGLENQAVVEEKAEATVEQPTNEQFGVSETNSKDKQQLDNADIEKTVIEFTTNVKQENKLLDELNKTEEKPIVENEQENNSLENNEIYKEWKEFDEKFKKGEKLTKQEKSRYIRLSKDFEAQKAEQEETTKENNEVQENNDKQNNDQIINKLVNLNDKNNKYEKTVLENKDTVDVNEEFKNSVETEVIKRNLAQMLKGKITQEFQPEEDNLDNENLNKDNTDDNIKNEFKNVDDIIKNNNINREIIKKLAGITDEEPEIQEQSAIDEETNLDNNQEVDNDEQDVNNNQEVDNDEQDVNDNQEVGNDEQDVNNNQEVGNDEQGVNDNQEVGNDEQDVNNNQEVGNDEQDVNDNQEVVNDEQDVNDNQEVDNDEQDINNNQEVDNDEQDLDEQAKLIRQARYEELKAKAETEDGLTSEEQNEFEELSAEFGTNEILEETEEEKAQRLEAERKARYEELKAKAETEDGLTPEEQKEFEELSAEFGTEPELENDGDVNNENNDENNEDYDNTNSDEGGKNIGKGLPNGAETRSYLGTNGLKGPSKTSHYSFNGRIKPGIKGVKGSVEKAVYTGSGKLGEQAETKEEEEKNYSVDMKFSEKNANKAIETTKAATADMNETSNNILKSKKDVETNKKESQKITAEVQSSSDRAKEENQKNKEKAKEISAEIVAGKEAMENATTEEEFLAAQEQVASASASLGELPNEAATALNQAYQKGSATAKHFEKNYQQLKKDVNSFSKIIDQQHEVSGDTIKVGVGTHLRGALLDLPNGTILSTQGTLDITIDSILVSNWATVAIGLAFLAQGIMEKIAGVKLEVQGTKEIVSGTKAIIEGGKGLSENKEAKDVKANADKTVQDNKSTYNEVMKSMREGYVDGQASEGPEELEDIDVEELLSREYEGEVEEEETPEDELSAEEDNEEENEENNEEDSEISENNFQNNEYTPSKKPDVVAGAIDLSTIRTTEASSYSLGDKFHDENDVFEKKLRRFNTISQINSKRNAQRVNGVSGTSTSKGRK